MGRELEFYEQVERSIIKKYRKRLWRPFVNAVTRYELIAPGDRIAVCVSGGKDSMLLAKLMQQLRRITKVPFEAAYLVMDPGYSPANREKVLQNAALLRVPVTVFESDVFAAADSAGDNPCYLCARMRRGHLYAKARELGCNKIALGHHFSDVIETTVMAMFYGGQLQGMMPKLHSKNFPGMELIRPLYCVHEDDIIAWRDYNGLEFLRCACRFTEREARSEDTGKRRETKELIRSLKRTNPNIELSIFNSLHNLCLDTFPGYKSGSAAHSFLERYDAAGTAQAGTCETAQGVVQYEQKARD